MGVGERIVKLREQRQWSQRELARRAGLNFSVMNRIETNERPLKDNEIKIFAELFNVTSDYLLGLDANSIDQHSEETLLDPQLGLFFKEIKNAPEERQEQLRKIWEIIKSEGDRSDDSKC